MGGAGSATKKAVVNPKPDKKQSNRHSTPLKEHPGNHIRKPSINNVVEVALVNDSLQVVNISELHTVNMEGTFQQQTNNDNQAKAETRENTKDGPFSKQSKFTRGEIIGTGAYGKVYKGVDLKSNQEVAIKTVKISDDFEKAKKEVKALKDEIAILKALSHKNIVKYLYLDISEDNSAVEIVLEYVSGGSLRKVLDKKGKLSEKEASIFLSQILEGLSYLHSKNIIHRDIKGQNILMENDGTIKLSDFGTSKKLRIGEKDEDKDSKETEQLSRSLKGSPYWMAPEVILQTGHSFPADIWSVGCVLLEMIVGKPPYSNFSRKPIEVMKIIASGRFPTFPNNISQECKFFLERCIRYDPTERSKVDELLKLPFIKNFGEDSVVFINNNFFGNINNGNGNGNVNTNVNTSVNTNATNIKTNNTEISTENNRGHLVLQNKKVEKCTSNEEVLKGKGSQKIRTSGSTSKFYNQDELFINSAHAIINGELEKKRLEEKQKLKSLKQQQWEKELQEELLFRKKQL